MKLDTGIISYIDVNSGETPILGQGTVLSQYRASIPGHLLDRFQAGDDCFFFARATASIAAVTDRTAEIAIGMEVTI
ncbi:MAG: hypothetical protein ACE14T_09320 [Syntrophales bacterium]